MAKDPRFNLVPCDKAGKPIQQNLRNKKNFFDAVRNIGDLEALNDLGYGEIGEGLRTLAGVSDSVRTGESVVPGREGSSLYNTTLGGIANTAVDNVEQGANVVLDATGIGRGALDAAANVDANVANRALGQAKSIFEQVKQGNFQLNDIPQVFSDLQNLEILTRSIYKESPSANTKRKEICQASPYALDLIAWAPKFKFLFVVDIKFAPEYQQWNRFGTNLSFVVKQSSRPNIEFEYEEVNMYNFRTRVPKRTIYQPVTMRFYDDNKNNAIHFYTAYLRAMSPIANIKFNQQVQGRTGIYESSAMDYLNGVNGGTFQQGDPGTRRYSASLGALNNNTVSLIQEITFYHIFQYGSHMDAYRFYNPKILNFEPDELDQTESGSGSEMAFQFAYDSLYVEPSINVDTFGREQFSHLTGNRVGANYPIRPTFDESGNTVSSGPSEAAPSAQQSEQLADPNPGSSTEPGSTNSITGVNSNAFNTESGFNGSSFA